MEIAGSRSRLAKGRTPREPGRRPYVAIRDPHPLRAPRTHRGRGNLQPLGGYGRSRRWLPAPAETGGGTRRRCEYQVGATVPSRMAELVLTWWRAAAVVLVVLLVVVVVLPYALERRSIVIRTEVDWFHYSVVGEPNSDIVTPIDGALFCPPANAITEPILSMVWTTSPSTVVNNTRLWTLLPPNATLPEGRIVVLYEGFNLSSGGTSFVSAFPFPCGYLWNLDSISPTVVTVSATFTLTYNYTAIETNQPTI